AAGRDTDELRTGHAQERVGLAAPAVGTPIANLRPAVVGEQRAAAEEMSNPIARRVAAGAVTVGLVLDLLRSAAELGGHHRHFEAVAAAFLDPRDAAGAERNLGDAVPGAPKESRLHARDPEAGSGPDEDPAAAAPDARRHGRPTAVG